MDRLLSSAAQAQGKCLVCTGPGVIRAGSSRMGDGGKRALGRWRVESYLGKSEDAWCQCASDDDVAQAVPAKSIQR